MPGGPLMYEDQLEEARAELERILTTGRVKGVYLGLGRGHGGVGPEWGEPLNPGYFGIPGGSRKYVVAPATASTRAFLRLQARLLGTTLDESNRGAYDKTVQEAREAIELGSGTIPTPVIDIRATGKISQEGRSRALGAFRAGADRMPVWVAVQVYR